MRLQFSLRTLLLAVTMVALALSLWKSIDDHRMRRVRAARELARLGALIVSTTVGGETFSEVYLPGEWAGGEAGLSHLADLPEVRRVFFSQRPVTVYSGPRVPPPCVGWSAPSGITDGVMSYFARVKNLEWLDLTGTEITGSRLADLTSLRRLRLLDLQNTSIKEEYLGSLDELQSLEWLSLRGTQVSDNGVAYLVTMKSLRYLDVGETSVTDKSLLYLSQIKALKYLIVPDGNFTTQALCSLRERLPGCRITIERKADRAKLEGVLPSCNIKLAPEAKAQTATQEPDPFVNPGTR